MIHTLTTTDFCFEEYATITEIIENGLDIDSADLFYQVSFYDDSPYWEKDERGCCICLYLIYSDEPASFKPIEITYKNKPISNPINPERSRLIQDYLRRHQKE